MWIDNAHNLNKGEFGFLVEITMVATGYVRHEAQRHPQYTVCGGNPQLHGCCGELNGRRTTACGLVEVVGINTYGDRIEVRRLPRREERPKLKEMGYPKLR